MKFMFSMDKSWYIYELITKTAYSTVQIIMLLLLIYYPDWRSDLLLANDRHGPWCESSE